MQYDGTMNQQINRPAVGWSNVYFDRMGISVRQWQWLSDFDLGHFKLFIAELL